MRISFLLLLILPFSAFADVCFPSLERDSVNAKVIFTGELIDISKSVHWNPKTRLGFDAIFTFKVSESFKGLDSKVTLLSVLGPGRGCCNVQFQLDSTYLVFAYEYGEQSGIYWTNDCSMTAKLSESQVVRKLLRTPKIHESNDHALRRFNEIGSRPDSLISIIQNQFQSNQNLSRKANSFKIMTMILGFLVIGLAIILFRIRIANTSFKQDR